MLCQYWPWHLCKSSYETYETYETYEIYETYETNEKEANWKSREELTQTNYASHPGTRKRWQNESQGRSWPKPIIQVILVRGKGGKLKVKGGADLNQLCKSSWYVEKEANWKSRRSWPKPIMQVILVCGKGGKLKVKRGADPNQLCKSSLYVEKEANWKSREELTQTNYASHPGTWKRRQTESQGRSWPKPMMQVILVCGKGGKLKVNVMKCRGPNGPF